MLSIIQVIIGLMICISWFLKFRGERAANYFVSSIASRKNGGKFMAPTKLAFLLLEKDERGKENGGSDET